MKKIILGIHTLIFLLITGCSSVPISEETATKSTQNEKTISVLNNLIQVDIDTYHTYEQAMQVLKKPQYTKTLKAFRDEHEQRIRFLSKIVIAKGGVPPAFLMDFKGYAIPGYTTVKKGTVYSIFQTIEANEALSVMYHNDALKVDLPSDVKHIIQMHCETEEKHFGCVAEMKKQV